MRAEHCSGRRPSMIKTSIPRHRDDPAYPGAIQVQIFGNETRALEHFEKHVNNPKEPWEQLLGNEALETLQAHYQRWRECATENARWDAFQALYAAYTMHLGQQLKVATHIPRYVVAEYVDTAKHKPTDHAFRSCYFFVTDEGLFMTVRNGVLRTAHFKCSSSISSRKKQKKTKKRNRTMSPATLRSRAMENVLTALERKVSPGFQEAVKVLGIDVVNNTQGFVYRNVHFINEESWKI